MYTSSRSTQLTMTTLIMTQQITVFPLILELKSVCKKMLSAFEQERWLHHDMIIPANSRSLDELIAWAEQHHASIENVVTMARHEDPLNSQQKNVNPFTDLILVALHIKRTCLLSAHINGASGLTMQMLANFSCITQCELSAQQTSPSTDYLSLSALQALPELHKLTLKSGNFTNIAAARHLTFLDLDRAHCYCAENCAFVTSLTVAMLVNSELLQFDEAGPAACLGLRRLVFCDARVTTWVTIDDQEELEAESDVLYALPALTKLTSLQLKGVSERHGALHCTWLGQMRELEYLFIAYDLPLQRLPSCVSVLTKLRTLIVYPNGKTSSAIVEFDWMPLQFLEIVHLAGRFQFVQGLDALAFLPYLRHVSLEHVLPADAMQREQVPAFTSKLKDMRPTIWCH